MLSTNERAVSQRREDNRISDGRYAVLKGDDISRDREVGTKDAVLVIEHMPDMI